MAEMGSRVGKLMGAFAREMKVGRGLIFRTMQKLYRKVVEPGLMYGVEFWGPEVMRREVLRRRWCAVQRKVLLKMIGAYRTVSAEAACVLAGVEPVDLKIGMHVGVAEDMRQGIEKGESREVRRRMMMEEWQRRWDGSEKGRVTYEYIPRVDRQGSEEWGVNHYVTQALTGHGNFKSKLRSFGLVESELCVSCGVAESEEHVVFECADYEGMRIELRERILSGGGRWSRSEVMKVEYREEFFEMVRSMLKQKEDIEDER